MEEMNTPSSEAMNTQTVPPHVLRYNFRSHKFLLLLLFFIIGLLVGIFFARLAPKSQQTITVIGRASQTVKADKAVLTATTYVSMPTVPRAQESNEMLLNEIRNILKQNGINPTSLQIVDTRNTNYTNSGVPVPSMACLGAGCASSGNVNLAYSVSSDIKIEFAKDTIHKLNTVSDAITGLGVYPTVVYNIADKDAVWVQNKEKAIVNAKLQAESLAKSNNEKVKKIVGIKEVLPQQDSTNASLTNDPTVDSAYEDIPFSSSFEVTYELSTPLF